MDSSPRWCLCISSALCSFALWSPTLALSALFIYLGGVHLQNPDNARCEKPIAAWAFAGGLAMLASAAVWFCSAVFSACAQPVKVERPPMRPTFISRLFPGRTAFEALSALRSTPTTCVSIERSMYAVLAISLVVWLVLGAAWVWPLHDVPHHCSVTLVSVSFYTVFGLLVAVLIIVGAACVTAMCLTICGIGIRNAVDGVADIIHGMLALSEGSGTAGSARRRSSGDIQAAPEPARAASQFPQAENPQHVQQVQSTDTEQGHPALVNASGSSIPGNSTEEDHSDTCLLLPSDRSRRR